MKLRTDIQGLDGLLALLELLGVLELLELVELALAATKAPPEFTPPEFGRNSSKAGWVSASKEGCMPRRASA